MHTALVVILAPLILGLAAALVAHLLRPDHKLDVMQQAVGDAPRLVRGGYAAMDEKAPIQARRRSNAL